MQSLYDKDHELLVWWATEIECASALARLERNGDLPPRSTKAAFERLDALTSSWNEIQPLDPVRSIARRLLRTHDLRAADACQLAAALIASERQPTSLEFVSLDSRLVEAAEREGLLVVEPAGR